MAQPFIVDTGIEIDADDGITATQILNGTVDPTVSPGVAAPISSSFTRKTAGSGSIYTITVFDKVGPLDTDWLARVSSAATGSLDTIGTPDDTTYTDGLFGWTPATKISNAVDDVNEFLALMAPPAAPNLTNIGVSAGGVTGKLSFDTTHTISGYAYDAATINTQVSYTGNDLGIYNGTASIAGVLNSAIVASTSNSYPAKAFGHGKEGVLELWVNGALVHTTASLATFGAGVTAGSGSYFTLSAATPCQFSNGNAFPALQYRTGTFTIASAAQRGGYNYAEVRHVTGTTYTTNQFYWYNSLNVTAITADTYSLTPTMAGSRYLSGVQYYTSGTLRLQATVHNAYADVYSASATAVAASSVQATYTGVALATTTSNTADYAFDLSAAVSSSIRLLAASASATATVLHPVKSTFTSPGQSSGQILYDPIVSGTALFEDFNNETYRTSAVQASAGTTPAAYSSFTSLATTTELQVYNSRLVYPTLSFKSVADGGAIQYAPAGNPTYVGLTGSRTMIRAFQNTSGQTKANFKINLVGGSTTFVPVGSLTGNNLSIEMKFPTGSLTSGTGWLDAYADFATGAWADGNGCRAGSFGNGRALATDWGMTVGTKSIAANEWVYVRITAPASWTGYLDSITFTWI